MKNQFALILVLVLIFSCSNAKKSETVDANKTEQAQSDSYLSAKVDGVKFHIDDPTFYSAQRIVTLAAVSKDKSEKIRIYINYTNGATTYIFGEGISNSDNMVYTKDKVDYLAAKTDGKGTITFVDEVDYLTATFSFTGVDKKTKNFIQVTEGKFRVIKK